MSQAQSFGANNPQQDAAKGEQVIIVGTGDHAAFAFECFTHDSPHQVIAFSAEREFLDSDERYELPIVPFDQLAGIYPPNEYRVFVAASGVPLNRVRRRLFDAVKAAGFQCVSYISRSSFIWNNVELGENVFVAELSLLHYGVRIGDNVVIEGATHIGRHTVIEDDCFVGPRVTLAGECRVGRGSVLGVGSCISNNCSVSEDCIIGPGTVVVADTQPRQVYVGNPARLTSRDSSDTVGVQSDRQ